MSAVKVDNRVQFSDKTGSVPVFQNIFANDYARIKNLEKSLSEFLEVSFDKPMRTEGTNKVFQSSAENEQLTAFLKDGSRPYTNWKESVILSEEQVSEYRKAVEGWLS